ncbi:MAG: HAD hydrolase-like protein [Gammaproteobacteria bacterium]|nr:HAD hydrolase-like protein [Gammaproteobacteria bacterium]
MHVFFDLDGMLTDPKEGITACIKYALSKLEHPIPAMEVLKKCIGPPLHDSFVDILGSVEAADRALGLYRQRFGRIGMYENRLYAGVKESLSRLGDQVESMYVVTSKPTVYSEKIIDHFDLTRFFRKVYGSNLDGSLTDKSDLIRFVLESESIAPSAAIMIGDRYHDITGAKENGLRTVGVLWGYGSRQELEDAGADVLCETPKVLHDCIVAQD